MPAGALTIDSSEARRLIRSRSFSTDGLLVGAEVEWICYPVTAPSDPVPFDDLQRIADGTDGLTSVITYEPGGQIELSSPPRASIGETCRSLAEDLARLRTALRSNGIALHGIGLDPERPDRRVLTTPRYAAMERYFDAGGPAGRRMMCRTAAVQVNLDLGEDPNARWTLAHAIGPMLAAAFANSPFVDGRRSPWVSSRLATWWAMDRTRTAPVPEGSDARDAWERYVLDANVMLIRTPDDRFEPVMDTMTFATWMSEGHPLGFPTRNDLIYHLTTLFPPVRPRGWLELRMIDALPDPWWRVAIAVSTALLYDAEAAQHAATMCRSAGGRWLQAFSEGPRDPILRSAIRECFDAALDALPRLGADRVTIDATRMFAERYAFAGRCPADDLIELHAAHGTMPPFATMPAPIGS